MANSKKKVLVLALLGPGSSGKDTQAELIEPKDFKTLISTGDVLRASRQEGSDFHRKYFALVEPHLSVMDKGGYVPDEVMAQLFKGELEEDIASGAEIIVSTGFPRTVGQQEVFKAIIDDLNAGETHEVISHIINFALKPETSRDRAKNRREKDLAAGKEPRRDDQPEVVDRRLATYVEQTYPLIEVLSSGNAVNITTIDAERTIEEIAQDVNLTVQKLLNS